MAEWTPELKKWEDVRPKRENRLKKKADLNPTWRPHCCLLHALNDVPYQTKETTARFENDERKTNNAHSTQDKDKRPRK